MIETKRACNHVHPSGRTAEAILYRRIGGLPVGDKAKYTPVYYCTKCGRLRYERGRKQYPAMFVRPYKKRGRRLGLKRAKR